MKRRTIGVLLLLAALACVWIFGLLDKRAQWMNLQYSMAFRDGKYAFDETDEYGLVNNGPSFDLPAGEYRLTFNIDADGENAIQFSSENGVHIEPDSLAVMPHSGRQTVTFTLEEAAKAVEIQAVYADGTYMDVYEISLEGKAYADNRFTLTFAALLLAGLSALYRKEKERTAEAGSLPMERMRVALILLAAVAFASIPTMKDSLTYGLDTAFHIARIRNLADGLRAGQFPVRVGGFSYNGYGAVTSVFYPDFLLTPLALMLLGGASVPYMMHIWIVAINALTAAATYACARRMLGGRMKAAGAAVLYTLSADRLMSLYTRAAMGEMMALSLFPLFVWGLWEVLRGDKTRWGLLALGATCIFQCHMISTLLCVGVALAMGAASLPRVIREKRWMPLIYAAVTTVLLNLFVLVPMATFSRQGVSAGSTLTDSAYWLLEPAQLFLDAIEGQGSNTGRVIAGMNTDAIVLGLPLLAGVFIAGYRAATGEGRTMRRALALGLFGAALAFCCTTLSPWRVVNERLGGLLNYVQMPFRMLTMASFFMALCGGEVLCGWRTKKRGEVCALALLVLCAACVHPLLSDHALSTDILPYGREDFQAVNMDYRLPNMRESTTEDTDIHIEGGAQAAEYRKAGTRITAQIQADRDAKLTVPLFAFAGYEASVEGQKMKVEADELDRLTVCLPAGTKGRLDIRYVGIGYWRIADAVSLAALALLAGRAIGRRRKAERV